MTLPSPQSVAAFLDCGWTEEQASAGASAMLSPALVRHWMGRLSLTPQECLSWWAVTGPDPATPHARTVAEWVEAGVRRPQDRPPGMSVTAVYLCRVAGVPADPGWGERSWTGRARTPGAWLCPHLMRASVDLGQAPAVAGALMDAARVWWDSTGLGDCTHVPPPVEGLVAEQRPLVCGWYEDQSETGREFLSSLAGLDWADVTTCLRAGMTPSEARAHVAAGAEMEPVQLVAALTR